MTIKIKDLKNKIEGAVIAVASVNKEGNPHNIAIAYAKIKEGKIVITDNYMKKTIENIKNNPHLSLVFWKGEEGWRIDGKAEYHNCGKWLDFVKLLKENKGMHTKGAIVLNVKKIEKLI